PPPPPCFNRDPGTNPSVGSVATRVRRVRARLTSALYTPTACGQRPLTQAGGGQGKFRTRLSGLAPPSGPNRRTTMHSYSARFNDDKNKKTQSVVTALGLASGPQEEGGGGGGGGEEMGGGRWRHGSDFAAEGGGGTGSSAPPARAARTATPPRWGAFRPPCLVSACACQPAGRSGRPPRPGRKAAADGGGDSASMPSPKRAAKMPGPGSPAARAGRSLLLGRGDGRGRAAGRWLVGSLRQVTWAMPVSTARRMQYNNLAARHVEQVLPARERRRLAA
ncbi:unnamed protein product, partial [Prorocentrum cordatum]